MHILAADLLKRLPVVMALAFFSGAAFVPTANAQGTITFPRASVRVLNELDRPLFRRRGDFLFHETPPPHLDAGARDRYRTHYVLASNTNPYPFVVDASRSRWLGPSPAFKWSYFVGNDSDGEFFTLAGPSASPYYTNQPPYLSASASREMRLDITAGSTSDHLWFGVVVLTPQSATDRMSEWLDDHFDRPRGRVQRRLLPPLREASAHFAAGETEAGKDALRVFVQRLRVSRHPLRPHQARVFKALSQAVIDTAHDED